MTTRLRPFLMFEGNAEAVMTFYVSLFPNSKVLTVERYGAGQPGPEGTIMLARFSIAGQELLCSDSFIEHGFTFTPSLSLFFDCESEQEISRLATALAEDGAVLMPLDNYGFSQRFAWINDRFGVSWQLTLA